MAKRVDTSGLNTDYVISQAKPENRGQGRVVTSYDPSASEPTKETDVSPETDPIPTESPVEPESQPETKEPSKRRRGQAAGYKDTFLKRNEMKTRQCVYISHDVHALIAKLVRVLAVTGKEVTVGGYIDTVLSEHLQANKDEINEIYRQWQGDLL